MGPARGEEGAAGRGVFVDTSAWASFFLATERNHSATVRCFDELAEAGRLLVTTDYVLAETVTLLRSRAGLTVADRAWEAIEDGQYVELVEVDGRLRARARDIFRKYGQLVLSLVDCVSFALMRELEINEALTSDADFEKAGFTTLPRRGGKQPA